MTREYSLNEQIAWLHQSIECGHSQQAASEAKDIVRYCRRLLAPDIPTADMTQAMERYRQQKLRESEQWQAQFQGRY